MKKRVILHCDCNSFFASVETVLDPRYKNVPMAVCGSVEHRHGIVLAKNEEAKKYGVVTAETVSSALKKCPNLVIASPHYDEYVKYSKLANEIYSSYTDMVEPFGIDESWLDVTASEVFGTGEQIAEKIRSEIKSKLGITVSVGVSFNKVFAKLGSDYKKPDAVTVINADNFKEIVYPLPASDLLFVGERTAGELKKIGISTIGDLASASPSMLEMKFGKHGAMLSRYARGEDDTPVSHGAEDDVKSISNGYTFKHDLVGYEECRMGIDFLCEEIGLKLRKKGLKCNTVQISLKDQYLRVIQRQNGIDPPTDIGSEIADNAYALLCRVWNPEKPIRMITVGALNLMREDETASQLSLFDSDEKERDREKRSKKEIAMEEIRQRFGTSSIVRASVMDEDLGLYPGKKK